MPPAGQCGAGGGQPALCLSSRPISATARRWMRLFAAHQPDIVHASGGRIPCRPLDRWARRFIDTNITGTFNMLEAARKYWQRAGRPDGFRFHHVSTDEVFGSLPADPAVQFTEATAYDPRSPYSASKAASDHLVRAWHETYGLPVVLSNCSNNYGPYHFPEKLIPVVILNALAGRALPIYGDGSNIRDWLYVEDHADALLLVATRARWGAAITSAARTSAQTCSWCKRSAPSLTGCARARLALRRSDHLCHRSPRP